MHSEHKLAPPQQPFSQQRHLCPSIHKARQTGPLNVAKDTQRKNETRRKPNHGSSAPSDGKHLRSDLGGT
eukprot:1974303-Rhodomonas_salina.1